MPVSVEPAVKVKRCICGDRPNGLFTLHGIGTGTRTGPAQTMSPGSFPVSDQFEHFCTQESPPAWTQDAYRPLRIKCSLCWRGVPSPRSGGGVPRPRSWGGTPSQVRREGTLSQVRGGYPIPGLEGVPHPDLVRGVVPQVPPPGPEMGYPPATPGMGYPPSPSQIWDGVPPPWPDLGWGTPPASRPEMGYPHNGEQTDIPKYKYYLPSYYVCRR